jgi:hypothetical protein
MKHLTAFMAMMALGWCTGPLCAQTASAREWFDRAAQEFVQQDKITALLGTAPTPWREGLAEYLKRMQETAHGS